MTRGLGEAVGYLSVNVARAVNKCVTDVKLTSESHWYSQDLENNRWITDCQGKSCFTVALFPSQEVVSNSGRTCKSHVSK